jgi:Ca2+-binding EF-hand superfamily protein
MTLLLLIVVHLVGPGSVSAENTGNGQQRETGQQDLDPQQILKLMGAKGLAAASPNEVEDFKRVFNRLDTDGDRNLTKQEYIQDGVYGTKEMRTGIFRATDRDADGILTEKEYVENRTITDEAKDIFQKMDTDADRNVSEKEFLDNSTIEDQKTAKEVFRRLDTNGNGQAALIEYLRVWGDWARQGRMSRLEAFSTTKPAPGQPAPQFQLRDLQGRSVSLAELLKSKPLVLEFGSFT